MLTVVGMALQNTMLIVQYDLKGEPRLISAGTGLIVFSMFISLGQSECGSSLTLVCVVGFAGRIIGISLAGSVFQNMIKVNLHKYASDLPIQYMEAIVNSASAVWTTVPQVSSSLSSSLIHSQSRISPCLSVISHISSS